MDTGDQDNVPAKFQSFIDQERSHLAVLRRYSLRESPFVLSLVYEQTVKSQEDGKIWRTKERYGQVNMTSGAFSTCLQARENPIGELYHHRPP